MDTSGLPVPDAIHPLVEQLQEALVLQVKFRPNLQLPTASQNDELMIGARDGSAHVLRCLKVWYELSSDVFFMAINLMDRFLTKMKVLPKHMACISVSSFYIAAVQLTNDPKLVDVDHIVSISQCKCTGGDLKRMSEVIQSKLNWAPGTVPVTPLTFIRIFNAMFHVEALQLGISDIYSARVTESELLLIMEMIACDGSCSNMEASEVALVLLCTYLDIAAGRLASNADSKTSTASGCLDLAAHQATEILRLVDFASHLQKMCNISQESFFKTRAAVGAILDKYNAQEQSPHRQRLIWKLSSRTARLLRPTEKFMSVLPVIDEHAPVPSPTKIRRSRKFSRRHGKRR